MRKIRFVKIEPNYIKFLHDKFDSRVQFDAAHTKEYENKPYIGTLLNIGDFTYFAPLEHPRPHHQNLKESTHIFKIKNGKFGLVGLNNMIPVTNDVIVNFDISLDQNSKILIEQFKYLNANKNRLFEKAKKVYEHRLNPNEFERKVFCNFRKLEEGCKEYCTLNGFDIPNSSPAIEQSNNATTMQQEGNKNATNPIEAYCKGLSSSQKTTFHHEK